jgi:hypothetical protein
MGCFTWRVHHSHERSNAYLQKPVTRSMYTQTEPESIYEPAKINRATHLWINREPATDPLTIKRAVYTQTDPEPIATEPVKIKKTTSKSGLTRHNVFTNDVLSRVADKLRELENVHAHAHVALAH